MWAGRSVETGGRRCRTFRRWCEESAAVRDIGARRRHPTAQGDSRGKRTKNSFSSLHGISGAPRFGVTKQERSLGVVAFARQGRAVWETAHGFGAVKGRLPNPWSCSEVISLDAVRPPRTTSLACQDRKD